METDEWRRFLTRWSAEWADAQGLAEQQEACHPGAQELVRARWLGYPPAAEEQIARLEERLGTALPPSYRSFLRASNGFRYAGRSVYRIGVAEEVHWHGDPHGLRELYGEDLDDDSAAEEVLLAGMWTRALQLSHDSDMTDVLLDPGDIDADGEWAVYLYHGWSGLPPERFTSFAGLMKHLYQEFHSAHARDPRFANDTTRALDAAVERARLTCLTGDPDAALAGFEEAARYGRPRAVFLGGQVRAMLGAAPRFGSGSMDDPVYAGEVFPLQCEVQLSVRRDDDSLPRRFGGDARDRARAVLRDVGERSFAYRPAGPFGEAVAVAREQARWGGTDAAWRTLAAALPAWRPESADHLAPLGLRADSVLGPLLTPERGRHVLSTPRAGCADHGSLPVVPGSRREPEPEPDGLSWLPEVFGRRRPEAFRFLLVHDVSPAALARRIGAGPLLPPADERDLYHLRRPRDGSGGLRHVARVGSAGGGWSFAFETGVHLGHLHPDVLLPPLDAAASGTRALAVWCDVGGRPGDPYHVNAFHCAYAADGHRLFAFTAHGADLRREGGIPEALRPEAHFAGATGISVDPSTAGRALDAVATEYGVSLPRFALCHGRLHAVESTSWLRPPVSGERFATITVGPVPTG